MAVDSAFKTVPDTTTCFLVWRIENFAPVPVPKDQYGSFFEGDSYIILSVSESGKHAEAGPGIKQREVRGAALDRRIHFWLGKDTTQDEAGACAIKAVELDDYLGGDPVQYRETQGHECKQFLNYYKKTGGIKYMPGGAASGFTHVEHTVKPRLMHVKGKSTPRIREVNISWSAMNQGDAYILDIGEAFYVWNGTACSRTERIKAMEYARRMRDDRGKGNIVVVEDGEESASTMGEDEFAMFSEYLPMGEKSSILSADQGGSDDQYERKAAGNIKLWKCSDAGGQLKVEEIAQKPLKKEMLDTNDVFIVDNGEAGIWVWCGRKASKQEKREGMANASAFIQQRNYSANVQMVKVHESAETTEFKALFKVWEKVLLPGQAKVHQQNKIARTVQTKFDASTLHSNPAIARETGMVDDGTGPKIINRIEREGNTYEMKEMKKGTSELYGGDSYVILYTYLVGGRENYIVYYWQGKKSTQDEKGVAAKKAVEVSDNLSGPFKQVRVVHGKEPNHFLAMFGGKLRVYAGGKAGWGGAKDEERGDTYMLHVRGTNQYNTKAEQVPCRAESLNSNDVFVLFSPSAVFIWAGKGCTGDEREMAKNVASISPRGYTLMSEGQEKEDFWNLIGGKGPYSTSPRLAVEEDDRPPRLFQCTQLAGFTVNEIVDFGQQDLVTDDVFLLDTYDTIYIWIGDDSREEEKVKSNEFAFEYLDTDPAGRDQDTPVVVVKQGFEDAIFVGYFGVWDRDLWSGGKSYEQLKKELGEKNVSMQAFRKKGGSGDESFSDVAKFTYAELTDRDSPPEGIDLQRKEKHLSDDEFQKVFGMDYAKFNTLPAWKQQQLKKDKQLF